MDNEFWEDDWFIALMADDCGLGGSHECACQDFTRKSRPGGNGED